MSPFHMHFGSTHRFFGGFNRTTIINNNFIGGMPMMRPVCRPMPMMPMFGSHCCGGNSNGLNWMLGFGLASSLAGGILGMFGSNNQSSDNNSYYNTGYNGYVPNNNYYDYNYGGKSNQYIADLTAKVDKLEDDLADCQKQIDDLSKSKCNCENKEITVDTNPTDEELINAQKTNNKTEKQQPEVSNSETPDQAQNNTVKNEKIEKTEEPKEQQEQPKTLDDILKNTGFDKLDDTAKNYVKSRISQVYIDDNGNVKYDIKAVVHDGDDLNAIINRFYTEEEKSNLEVAKAKLHTQGSESRLIVNPLSGDTIVANGVSEYGLKALMQDAQNGITKQGEITKTNKRISDLKTAFINGEKKLSKAYVLQNKLMTEAEYDKIINEKYS